VHHKPPTAPEYQHVVVLLAIPDLDILSIAAQQLDGGISSVLHGVERKHLAGP
jgi:hypothetical protein